MKNDSTDEGRTGAPDDLAQGVTEVIKATMGVGGSIARAVAEATSKEKPEPPEDDAPINVIVHYGLMAVNNMMNLVFSAVKDVRGVAQPGGPGPEDTDGDTTGMSFPRVQRGGTLRVPLSIENPGDGAMEKMQFACMEMKATDPQHGTPLDRSAVRFDRDSLTVEPRDFEKLTVFVDTAHDTAVGRYEAVIGLGNGIYETSLSFEVVPAENP